MAFLDAVPIIGPALDAVGGMVSAKAQRDAFKHRYQDTVADMKAAGLNPALAYGQGGGNPTTVPLPQLGESLTKATVGAANAKQVLANRELTKAQTDLLKAQTGDLVQNLRLKNELLGADTKLRGAQIGLTGAQTQAAGAQAYATTQEGNLRQQDFKRRALTFESDIQAQLARNAKDMFAPETAAAELRGRQLENRLRELSLAEAQAMANYYTGVGKFEPYANAITRFIQGIFPKINIQGDRTYAPTYNRR